MVKKAALVVATVLVLGLMASVVSADPGDEAPASAAPAPAPGGWYCPNYGPYYANTQLTDEQKAQISEWQKQMLEQREQILKKQVEWGWITQAQADQQIAWLKQRFANGAAGYGPYGPMMGGYGRFGGYGFRGRGCW